MMPRCVQLRESYSAPFERVRDNCAGLACSERKVRKNVAERGEVVPVNFADLKPERTPLFSQRLQWKDVFYPPIGLQLVVIYDCRERIEPVFGGGQRRFPDRTFVEFAIA